MSPPCTVYLKTPIPILQIRLYRQVPLAEKPISLSPVCSMCPPSLFCSLQICNVDSDALSLPYCAKTLVPRYPRQIEGCMTGRWLLAPLSAVFPKASAMPWTDITSHLQPGTCLLRGILKFCLPHCNSHCMLSLG